MSAALNGDFAEKLWDLSEEAIGAFNKLPVK